MGETRLDSRAVTMVVPTYARGDCSKCKEKIIFTPPGKEHWVLANVYKGRGQKRKWDHLEHFHESCYSEAGLPYGLAPYKKTKIVRHT